MGKRVCIDFDETIHSWKDGSVVPGAKEAINKLKEKGFEIIIYSCRTSNEYQKYSIDRQTQVYEMSYFLEENGIQFDQVLNNDKPIADFYLDDKARQITYENWNDVAEEIINGTQANRVKKYDIKTIVEQEMAFELVAVIDGQNKNQTINLYLKYDGDIFQEIRWPDDWPEKVSTQFLEEKGFRVVTA